MLEPVFPLELIPFRRCDPSQWGVGLRTIHMVANGQRERRTRLRLWAALPVAVLLYAAPGGWAQIGGGISNSSQQQDQPVPLKPAPLIAVHGVVRNGATGEPLPRALVRLEGDAATGALTDGDGRFEIDGLTAGPQIFEVVKPGFDDRPNGAGSMALDDTAGFTHNVMVAAEMPDLVFTMAPTNAIRGQIELSTGDPAQGIEVQLLKRAVQDGRAVWQAAGAVKTTSDGTYRFAGLGDGSYAVYTNPAMDSDTATMMVAAGSGAKVARDGYASVFYPDARDLAGAAKIHVANGEQAQANLQLALEPFHSVTATATTSEGRAGQTAGGPGSPAERALLSYSAVVEDMQGHQLAYVAMYDQTARTIQTLLPDGAYSLLLTAAPRFTINLSAGSMGANFPSSSGSLVGSVEFTVTGHAIANLRVPLAAPRTSPVQLNIVHSGSGAAAAVNSNGEGVTATLSQAGGWIGDGLSSMFAQANGPGAMETTYNGPGTYWAHAHIGPKALCEASFTAGGASLAREPLVLSLSGASAPMELTLRDDCAKLTLTLPPAMLAFAAGEEPYYTVYVVPDFDSTVDLEPVTLRPTSGASVTVEGLTPGSYHVYTFLSPVALEYRNRAALSALPEPGQAVTLTAGATGTLTLEAPPQP